MPAKRKYPDELRERGVRLALESNRPVSQIAKDLGIQRESLRRWVRQAEADEGKRADLLSSDERERLKTLEREVKELRRANEILKAASVFFRRRARPTPAEVSAFIEQRRSDFGVEPICRTLEVSASAYYERAKGKRSAREVSDEQLLAEIKRVQADNYEAYGSRRTWKELHRRGIECARCAVERLMQRSGIQGAKRRGKPWRTTTPDPEGRRKPDLVDRDFTAEAPNRLWVADFTHLRTWEGVVFFSFVIDVFSRTVVGWQLATNMRTDLVLDALRMALGRGGRAGDRRVGHLVQPRPPALLDR